MKKYIIGILSVVLIIAGCTKDEDKWSEVQKDIDVGGAIPFTKHYSPKIFDIVDLDNTALNFKLLVGANGEGAKFTQVNLYKSYNGGPDTLHAEYTASQIPADVKITVADALTNLPGITKDSLTGGDYFDWTFEMVFPDGSTGEYNVDAAGTFPHFRAYVASSPDFDIVGDYTTNIEVDDWGMGTQGAAISIEKIGGTANSQYILSDGDSQTVLNWFGLNLAYRILYVGNNVFQLWPRAEGFLSDYFGISGTVTYDPGSGKLTFDGVWVDSYAGISGSVLKYELIPAS